MLVITVFRAVCRWCVASTAIRVLAFALGAAATVGCGGGSSQPTSSAHGLKGGELPAPLANKTAPYFALKDARDGTLTSSQLHGKPYAVTFLYTQCPDVCPLIAQELRAALDQLGPQAKSVAVVAVSVDPRGDTRNRVEHWLKRNREPANFHYLIGTRKQLQSLWKAYYVGPQIEGKRGSSTHTANIWLVDRLGRWRAKFSAGVPVDPLDISHDFRALLS